MDSNRREFIVRSSLAVAAGALVPGRLFAQQAPAAQQPPTVPMFASLRRNVGTFTARGGTMGWLVGPDAVVVIDSQFADTSKMFLEGFKPMIGGRKIDLLINTHHHPDHTGGNKVLQPSVIKIVAQENAPGLQRKQAAAQKSEDQQAYADTIYVFGPSKVGSPVTGPKGDLLALRDYFSAMLDYVQKGIKAGKSADEIVKAGLPQFAAHEGAPQLQVAYDELTAKKA
jgi:glyoxylase-like metal-dependent hydrolase (beta-lactamase superfamily II)